MPRAPRIEYEDAAYHVMARGNRRLPIVYSDADREIFAETLSEAADLAKFKTWAWVLLDNHYHWVLETPKANLVEGMTWFQNAITRRINARNRLWGHLFGGRYKAILIEGNLSAIGQRRRWQRDYLSEVIDYVHLNPARAKLAGPANAERPSVADYAWSSLAMGYALPPSKRPKHLHVDTFKHFDLDDTTEGRRAFIRRLDAIAAAEADIELPPNETGPLDRLADLFERGWVHGSDTFRELVLDAFAPKATGKGRAATNTHYRSSELGKAFTEAEAARILAEGLEHFGLDEAAVRKTPKGDWRKVAIAWAICERTTARQDWIAKRLHLKSASNVSQRVRQYRLLDPAEKLRAMREWEKRVKGAG
jgi:REP element-mobilizing transposase RayT